MSDNSKIKSLLLEMDRKIGDKLDKLHFKSNKSEIRIGNMTQLILDSRTKLDNLDEKVKTLGKI